MAFPNVNFLSNRPNIALVANPHLPRYDKILSDLGWFSWVYKDRDPLGFVRHADELRMLGIDQIVSDIPLKLPATFRTKQNYYPYVYSLSGAYPKAYMTPPLEMLEPSYPPDKQQPVPIIDHWDETHLVIETGGLGYLFLQKTFLPGWKAWVNGQPADPFRCNKVLTAVSSSGEKNIIELKFEPAGLRLGFFLFFAFFAVFSFLLIRFHLS
jgi:hypothetical protein